MGNKATQCLPVQIYETKLNTSNESKNSSLKTSIDKVDIIDLYSSDILQILLSFCERAEQCKLINIMFSNLKSYKKQIAIILNKIDIKPTIDIYLITAFNKKNYVLSNIESAMEYKFYFTNINIKGTDENIKYLKSNTNNIMYAMIYFISVKKKDILKPNNSNHALEIDKFMESYKNYQYKDMKFNTEDIFYSDDEKLENIKYKNTYKFEKFERIKVNDINIDNLSWKEYNDIFLKYMITNQLNYCCDDTKIYNKDINEYIDFETDDRFNILSGCSLFSDPLIGYNLNSKMSKHTEFLGDTNVKTYKKSKKVFITTTKMSSIFLVNNKSNDMNVFTVLNKSSDDHIKEKISTAKKIKTAYLDSVARSGF